MFLLASGLYAGCGLFNVIFATGEVQTWNDLSDNKEKITEKSSKDSET